MSQACFKTTRTCPLRACSQLCATRSASDLLIGRRSSASVAASSGRPAQKKGATTAASIPPLVEHSNHSSSDDDKLTGRVELDCRVSRPVSQPKPLWRIQTKNKE